MTEEMRQQFQMIATQFQDLEESLKLKIRGMADSVKSEIAKLNSPLDRMDAHLDEIRRFVEKGIANLRGLLNRDPALAKSELQKHLSEIRMIPTEDPLDWHYVAEGTWNLLANDPGLVRTRQPSDWRIRMVAGVGFEPTTSGL